MLPEAKLFFVPGRPVQDLSATCSVACSLACPRPCGQRLEVGRPLGVRRCRPEGGAFGGGSVTIAVGLSGECSAGAPSPSDIVAGAEKTGGGAYG